MSLRNVKWIDFERKNPNKTEAFEKMCTHIFCREYNISPQDIVQFFNQTGIEISPVLVNKKYIGFQSKFCENSTKFYKEALDSVKKAIKHYPNLNKIVLYSHLKLGESKSRTNIIEYGEKNNCKIEICCNVQFDIYLSKYPDIYDYYFSDERIKKMFYEVVSLVEVDFLKSSSYLDLRLNDKPISTIIKNFLNRGTYLIDGKAGTGKTQILKKIYLLYVEEYNNRVCNDKVTSTECIKPIFIKLRELTTTDLISKINSIKMQYHLKDDSCKFAYFFDGVDEVSAKDFINCINSIKEVTSYLDTFSIFLTSRLDTMNYPLIETRLDKVQKYSIASLNDAEKEQFIKEKVDKDFYEKISNIIKLNSNLYNDIFSLSVLCNNFNFVNEDTTIVELIDKNIEYNINLSINRLLSLNLPEPKNKTIKEIMTNISYYMIVNSTLKISTNEISKILQKMFYRLDYNDINQIIESLFMMFFDVERNDKESYAMFKHKRYYEYFVYLYLSENMYKNPFILRDLEIFSQRELFLSFTLTQEIKNAKLNNDICKGSFLGFIISRLNKDYCRPYFNKWLHEKLFEDYYDIDYYDDKYVDYLSILKEDELKLVINNDELIFNAFINSNNNSTLLYSYLMKNKIDLSYIYSEKSVDFGNYNEDHTHYYLYKYMVGEIEFDVIKRNFFNFIDEIPLISEKNYVLKVKNNGYYNSMMIVNHFINYDINKMIEIINAEEMTEDRFERLAYVLLDDNISWVFAFSLNDENIQNLKKNISDKLCKIEKGKKYICLFAIYYLISKEKKENKDIEDFISKQNANHLMTWKNNEQLLSVLSVSLTKDIQYYHTEYRIVSKAKELVFFMEKKNEKEYVLKLIEIINDYSYNWSNFFTYDLSIFISTLFAKLNIESSNLKLFLNEVFPGRINKFAFIYNIFSKNINLFTKTFNIEIISKIFDESKNIIDEYNTLGQKQIMYSNMLSVFNRDLFYSNINKALNTCVFRPNYSKEYVISSLEPIALYMMIKNDLLTRDEQEEFLRQNLMQFDVSKQTLYRSNYQDKLKYLYKIINPSFEYRFDYDVSSQIPFEESINESLKAFDSCFINEPNIEEYKIDSFDFWYDCIHYLNECNNMKWIYGFLDRHYYPSFNADKTSRISHLIIGAMIKNNTYEKDIYDYIISKMSTDGYFKLVLAYIYAGNIDMAKEMLLTGYKLVNLMTFYNSKQFENMNLEIDFKKKITNVICNSKEDDYISTYGNEVLLYKKDNDIYIKRPDYDDESAYYDFDRDWAKFYGHKAKCEVYSIFYKGHVINKITILSVDEGRAKMPILDEDTGEYNINEYNFTLILCKEEIVKQYVYYGRYNIEKLKV